MTRLTAGLSVKSAGQSDRRLLVLNATERCVRGRQMTDWEAAKCEDCGHVGNRIDPVTEQTLFQTYNGEMLCASCRVDQRLKDGDYSND